MNQIIKKIIKDYGILFPVTLGCLALLPMEYTAIDPTWFTAAIFICLCFIMFMRVYFVHMAKYDLRGEEKANAWQISGKNNNTLSWRAGVFTILMILYAFLAMVPEHWFDYVDTQIAIEAGEVVEKKFINSWRRTAFYIYVFSVVSYSVEVVQWIARRREELNDRATEKEEAGELAELRRKEGEWETYHNSTVEELEKKHESFVQNLRAHLTAEGTQAKTELREEYEATIARTKEANEGLSMQLAEATEKLNLLSTELSQALQDKTITLEEKRRLEQSLAEVNSGQGDYDNLLAKYKEAQSKIHGLNTQLSESTATVEDLDRLKNIESQYMKLRKMNQNGKLVKLLNGLLGGQATTPDGKIYKITKEGELILVEENLDLSINTQPNGVDVAQALHPQTPVNSVSNQIGFWHERHGPIDVSNDTIQQEIQDPQLCAEVYFLNDTPIEGIANALNIAKSQITAWKKEGEWVSKRRVLKLKKQGLSNDQIAMKLGTSRSTLQRADWYKDLAQKLQENLIQV